MTDTKGSTSGVTDLRALHKQWDDTLCPICMDHPHNAVLLVCSSRDKGCRSYICDTSCRHSNCLDRFKKPKTSTGGDIASLPISFPGHSQTRGSYSVEESNNVGLLEDNNVVPMNLVAPSAENVSVLECLKCPLCRGPVLGFMMVKEARQYLDQKSRSCSHESCSFSGNYRELRRHARRMHPTTRPTDISLSQEHAWHRMEHQREYGDVLSAVRSAMPGAIVLGDYVIDGGDAMARYLENVGSGEDSEQWWRTLYLLHMIGSPISSPEEPRRSSRAWRTHQRSSGVRDRNLWGENHSHTRDRDDERNWNEDVPVPRRRRFTRSRHDEERFGGPDELMALVKGMDSSSDEWKTK